MTRETRVALVLGLGMIIAFGVTISAIKGTSAPMSASAGSAGEFADYSLTPSVMPSVEDAPRGEGLASSRRVALRTAGREVTQESYTVLPNDSLRKIARKAYGVENERFYTLIYAANRHLLPDESTIQPGQVLVIPSLQAAQDRAFRAARAHNGGDTHSYAARN